MQVTPRGGVNEAAWLVRVRDPAQLDYERVKHVNLTVVSIGAHFPTVSKHCSDNFVLNPILTDCAVQVAREAGRPGRASHAPLSVTVLDQNDNPPSFPVGRYEWRVGEGAGPGTELGMAQATDPDSGVFGAAGLRYTALRGSLASQLRLEPSTGVVSLKPGARLDRCRDTTVAAS